VTDVTLSFDVAATPCAAAGRSAARRGDDRRHVINATDGEPAESAALAVMCEHTIDHERMNVDIQIQLALRRRGFARCRA